ncbi:hypothetical protein GQ44DRAFT_712605, partial [Phaeosphaeriaceae sp. PMI808]
MCVAFSFSSPRFFYSWVMGDFSFFFSFLPPFDSFFSFSLGSIMYPLFLGIFFFFSVHVVYQFFFLFF